MPRPRIDGIYELGHVLYALAVESHGFGRDDIRHVECFWTFSDMHSSEAGFVLRLTGGRRAYVELLHTHAFEQVEDLRVDAAFVADEPELPAISTPNAAACEWSHETAHLDRVVESGRAT
jgi:hypothetical protein